MDFDENNVRDFDYHKAFMGHILSAFDNDFEITLARKEQERIQANKRGVLKPMPSEDIVVTEHVDFSNKY